MHRDRLLRRKNRLARFVSLGLIGALAMLWPAASAGAAPTPNAPGVVEVYVYSPAMAKNILLRVIPSRSSGSPTLYLLNGAAGGEEAPWDWLEHTDVVNFMSDKDTNVVIPIGGRESYYTDWIADDPVLGRNKWRTFLTQELPPIIDSMFSTNGRNAIAGLSMSGTAVLALAESAPGLYRSVASYSGCAGTSDPIGRAYVTAVVEGRGGGNVANMWGPPNSPLWVENDALINAEKLRGTALYISAGNGLAGPHDNLAGRNVGGDPVFLAQQLVVSGTIEAAINQCTQNLRARLDGLGIPAQYNFRPAGTHSWDYWQDDLHTSWPLIANSLR